MSDTTTVEEQNVFKRKLKKVMKLAKKPSKNVFWLWITYQVVKGTLTTTFIWIPLLYAWMHHS